MSSIKETIHPPAGSRPWSERIARHFDVPLSPDVVRWFDDELWSQSALVEFGEGIHPEAILATGSESAVWGGLMLPDTLPILSNGSGDALCLRFASDGSIAEVLAWRHEGGDWRPYGQTLAEALVYDWASGTRTTQPSEVPDLSESSVFAEWALQWTSAGTDPNFFQRAAHAPEGLLGELLEAGIAEVAARRDLCFGAVESGLSKLCNQIGGDQLAQKVGVEWLEFSPWLFDSALIPERYKARLEQIAQKPLSALLSQDWAVARREAERVNALRPDLAWPFAVMGWTDQRNGSTEEAIRTYLRGLKTLGLSRDFTGTWNPNPTHEFRKFTAARLWDLRAHLPSEVLTDPYLIADNQSAAGPIRDYWLAKGKCAETESRQAEAYHFFYRAGWDDFVFNDIADVLDLLGNAASEAGFPALSQLAKHHRKCGALS